MLLGILLFFIVLQVDLDGMRQSITMTAETVVLIKLLKLLNAKDKGTLETDRYGAFGEGELGYIWTHPFCY